MSLAEKLGEGFVIFIIGILVVFSILMILWALLAVFKVIFYTIPNKKKQKSSQKPKKAPEQKPVQNVTPVAEEDDDTEIVAVITAAVASMLGKSESGFKIKSIKRTSKWNKI